MDSCAASSGLTGKGQCMSARAASLTVLSILLSLCHSRRGLAQAGTAWPDLSPTTLARYPQTTTDPPRVASPSTLPDGAEVVVAVMKDGRYAVVPVTVENRPRHLSYGATKIGKGRQLDIDANDFPTLARTGLHAEEELDRTERITGKLVEAITEIGQPDNASGTGFMAADEDIISVLKGDNRRVTQLGLTHPQLARPLFHIWNLILKEYELAPMGRNWDNVRHVLYNGKKIRFGQVHPTRGFQESIFNDEIRGSFDINFRRDLDASEQAFLQQKYPHLQAEQMKDFVARLSHIRTGEMEPYYVMRYGFYEGHTPYRVDPIAIAFIFGLKTLEEIEAVFPGRLYETLTTHFTR